MTFAVMELAISYSKKRSEFGHYAAFDDVPTQILESIPSRWVSHTPNSFLMSLPPCVAAAARSRALHSHSAA